MITLELPERLQKFLRIIQTTVSCMVFGKRSLFHPVFIIVQLLLKGKRATKSLK